MKIQIERSGGFGGIIRKITVDTEELPKSLSNNLKNQLFRTKSYSNRFSSGKTKSADSYYYRITLYLGDEEEQIEFSEFDVDNKLRRMVNDLLNNNGG
jgi:hypothetical protein